MLSWNTPSGNIGFAYENQTFSFFFSYVTIPMGTVTLLSGEIPDGLILNNQDGSLMGVPKTVAKTKVFEFTLRLSNADGILDRSFYLTLIKDAPIWLSDSVIVENVPPTQNYRTRQYIEYQLQVSEPDIEFEFIAGKLPDGVILHKNGKIIGYIKDEGKTFEFTIRALTSEPIEKSFVLVILNDSQNRPPFWSTLPGWLGNLHEGIFYSFNLTGGDSDMGAISFTIHPDDSLPGGLTLTPSGILSGALDNGVVRKLNFRVLISDGDRKIERQFFIRCNYEIGDDDIWIIPPVNPDNPNLLGTIIQDEDAAFEIRAHNTTKWVRYVLESGQLPTGLSIDITTGDVWGTVDPTVMPGNYSFTVKAYNDLLLEAFYTFEIVVQSNQSYRPNKTSVIITGNDRKVLNEFYYNYKFVYEDIFRPGDRNFGITKTREILLNKYVDTTKGALFNVLKSRTGSEARAIKFKSIPVLDSSSKHFCDCVILVFEDKNVGADASFTFDNRTVKQSNIEILRTEIENNLLAPVSGFQKWQANSYTTILENDSFYSKDHDLILGKEVYFIQQNIASPFLNNTIYYAIPLDSNNFRLATSLQLANSNEYVKYNINDDPNSGYYHTHHNAIPIVYIKLGRGETVAEQLRTAYQADLSSITLYLKHVIFGPSTSRKSEDFEMLWFEQLEFFNG